MPVKKPSAGEDLLHMAQKDGVSCQAIMAHPENAELFACRDPAVLFTEDEIFIPDPEPRRVAVATGYTHYVVYKPPTRLLHLELRDASDAVRQTGYTLSAFEYEGKKPEHAVPLPEQLHGFAYQGIVHEELPASVCRLTMLLEDQPDQPFELALGRLEPVTMTRGMKARLVNLGLLHTPVDDAWDLDTSQALRAFQRSQGLAATGQADPETRSALVRVHGG